MIININTNRKQLRTWKEARAWCHVWWLSVIGGLDIGTMERSEIIRLARRFKVRLMQTLDRSGLHAYVGTYDERRCRYPFREQPYDGHYKTLESVLEMVDTCLRSKEKVTSWHSFAYGVSNALADGEPYAPPCQLYPGLPKDNPEEKGA